MSALPEPRKIIDYWIGDARNDAQIAAQRQRVWFGRSEKVDAYLTEHFVHVIAGLASGGADDWARQGATGRLAAIIVLDQFSRNVFRDTARAFENDFRALMLCKSGLRKGEDLRLSEIERLFFYMPLEHSESITDQQRSVDRFERLLAEARPEYQNMLKGCVDYALRHKAVIDRFGRFPHRNAVLGRQNTPEEDAFLSQPGSRF